MVIGVDFDNTIVCYDGLFRKFAIERGLVPDDVSESKNAVRDFLRRIGQEDRWTELQGYTYGPGMRDARLFPGVLEFFEHCRRIDQEVFVISQRTRYPFLGKRYDLHQAAREFLAEHGFNDAGRIGLAADHIRFHESKQEKVAQIGQIGCTHFIDDLPEILTAANFPADIEKILFDPSGQHAACHDLRRFDSWPAIENYLLRSA